MHPITFHMEIAVVWCLMCGVQCRPTFYETFELKNMEGLTLTCIHLSFRHGGDLSMLCLMQETILQNTIHYYSYTITTENQTNATLCLLAT
jgi:hypothetical protein